MEDTEQEDRWAEHSLRANTSATASAVKLEQWAPAELSKEWDEEQEEQKRTAPAPPSPRGDATLPSVKQERSEGGIESRKVRAADKRAEGGRDLGAELARERSKETRELEIQGGKGQRLSREERGVEERWDMRG